MLSPRVQLQQINPVHWARLADLLLPPPEGDPTPLGESQGLLGMLARATAPEDNPISQTAISPNPGVIVLHRGERVLRLLTIGGGRLETSLLDSVTADALRNLRRALHCPFVAAIDIHKLPEIWSSLQAGIELDDDWLVQSLKLTKALTQHQGEGLLIDPPLLGKLSLPDPSMLQMAFNRILPDDRSICLYLSHQGAIHCSLIAVKRDGAIELVTTHDALPELSYHHPREDAKQVVTAIGERLAPVHIGIFLPLSVWYELVAGDRSAVARAMASRKAVIDPAPPWLLAVVGAGAVAEAASRSGRLASQLLGSTRLGAQLLGSKTTKKWVKTLSNPLETLGIDPWELMGWARDWRRRLELDRTHFPTQEE